MFDGEGQFRWETQYGNRPFEKIGFQLGVLALLSTSHRTQSVEAMRLKY